MIITAEQMLKGGFRPPDRARAGRPGSSVTVCQECRAEPHHALGLGRACYDKTKGPARNVKRRAQAEAARAGRPKRQGAPRLYPRLCMHCKSGEHLCKGLCRPCYRKWQHRPNGEVQPFAPVFGPDNPYREDEDGQGEQGSA